MSSNKPDSHSNNRENRKQVADGQRNVRGGVFHRLLKEGWTPNWSVGVALMLMAPLVGIALGGPYGTISGFVAGLLILVLVFVNALRRERERQTSGITPAEYSRILQEVASKKQARLTAGMAGRPTKDRHISRDGQLKVTVACTGAYDKGAVYLQVYDDSDKEAVKFVTEFSQTLLVAGLTVNPLERDPNISTAHILGLDVQVNPASYVARSRWLPAFLDALSEIGLSPRRNDTVLGPHSQAITIVVGKNPP